MAGKAKPAKHTAKEIAGKIHDAKMKAGGAGGGINGKAKRMEPKQGKKNVFITCQKCFTQQPSLKTMQIHYQNKHSKIPWSEACKLYESHEQAEEKTEKVEYNYGNYQYNEEGAQQQQVEQKEEKAKQEKVEQ